MSNGTELSGIHGRYARVEARLVESASGILPRLIDVTVSTEPADLVTNAAPVFNLPKDTYETEVGVPVSVILGSSDDALGDRSSYEIKLNEEGCSYIHKKLKGAGCNQTVFHEVAVEAILNAADGTPCIINKLLRKKCLMRNVKNVTVLLTGK